MGSIRNINVGGTSYNIEDERVGQLTKVKHGTVIVQAKANERVTSHVEFKEAFSETPSVCAIPRTSFPDQCSTSVNNVSKTGFDVLMHRTVTQETGVTWIAVGK